MLASILLLVVAPLATAFLAAANSSRVLLDDKSFVLCAGFIAQLVDGSLGMGYGITSATILTSWAGLTPAAASATVHLAQLGTTAASGVSHWRCGNVDTSVVRQLSLAGVCGALFGSILLSNLDTSMSKIVSSCLLMLVGTYVTLRFAGMDASSDKTDRPRSLLDTPSISFLAPLGLVGGCVDAIGGGGWGPVATSGLLAQDGLAPPVAIGTVSLSEFFVTVAAVLGLIVTLGPGHAFTADAMRVDLAITLLLGGLAAAPIAPLLVRNIHPRKLGMLVGAFIVTNNIRGVAMAAVKLRAM